MADTYRSGMSDPFLLASGDEDSPAPRTLAPSFHDALRSAGVPQTRIDEFEALRTRWADLVADLRQVLESAGFRSHAPTGTGGGYWVTWHLRDDGVMVDWAVANGSSPEFSDRISEIMNPAILETLTACGFTAEQIPENADDAGTVLVTGRARTSSH